MRNGSKMTITVKWIFKENHEKKIKEWYQKFRKEKVLKIMVICI